MQKIEGERNTQEVKQWQKNHIVQSKRTCVRNTSYLMVEKWREYEFWYKVCMAM